MSNINDGGPAFPLHIPTPLAGDASETIVGMTLRDYFAAKAMQGLLSNPKLHAEILKHGGAFGGWIESSAYGWADAMLAAIADRLASNCSSGRSSRLGTLV